MNTLIYMLGLGLIKNDKKSKDLFKLNKFKKNAKRSKAVEVFLREKLGNHLIQNQSESR